MTNEAMEIDTVPCINLQILRASHRVLKAFEDAYRPFGVKATQMPVLALLAHRNAMTTREIAEQTDSERSVLSRKLAVMEKNQWIRSSVNPSTREKVYELTEAGKALLEQVQPVKAKVQAQLMGRLSEQEQNLLLNLCDKFHEI